MALLNFPDTKEIYMVAWSANHSHTLKTKLQKDKHNNKSQNSTTKQNHNCK